MKTGFPLTAVKPAADHGGHPLLDQVSPSSHKESVVPNVFGVEASSVEEILGVFRAHGDAVRGAYRARYRFLGVGDPYNGATLERPAALAGNPPDRMFPWEQIFVAAATCAGSDYPMLAAHLGVPLDQVEFVVEGTFDPRDEFDGLDG